MDDLANHIKKTIEENAGLSKPIYLYSQFLNTKTNTICQSIRINAPGIYLLGNDFVFDVPEDTDSYLFRNRIDPSDEMGQTAGIHIESDNVVLDLNGHSISMTPRFYAMQRYFNLIALNNYPFPPVNQREDGTVEMSGPITNVVLKSYITARYIMIRNGTFGLCSNSAIHGINSEYAIIEQITIRDFEKYGIYLNSPRYCIIDSVDITNSITHCPLNGLTTILTHFYRSDNNSISTETKSKISSFFNLIYKINNLQRFDDIDVKTYGAYLNREKESYSDMFGICISSIPPGIGWKIFIYNLRFSKLVKNKKCAQVSDIPFLNGQVLHKEYLEFYETEEILSLYKHLKANDIVFETLNNKAGCIYISSAYKCCVKKMEIQRCTLDFAIQIWQSSALRMRAFDYKKSTFGRGAIELLESEKCAIDNITFDSVSARQTMYFDNLADVSIQGVFILGENESDYQD